MLFILFIRWVAAGWYPGASTRMLPKLFFRSRVTVVGVDPTSALSTKTRAPGGLLTIEIWSGPEAKRVAQPDAELSARSITREAIRMVDTPDVGSTLYVVGFGTVNEIRPAAELPNGALP